MLWFLTRASHLYTPDVSRWAANFGLLGFVVELFQDDPTKQCMLVLSAAMTGAKHGQCSTFEWLWLHIRQYWADKETVARLVVLAARGGSLDLSQELYRTASCERAVAYRFLMESVKWGHIDMVKWSLSLPYEW